MAIKCSCGRKDCVAKIWFDENRMWFTNDVIAKAFPSQLSIYLDANGMVELIKEARKALIGLTEEKDGN